MEKVGRVGRCAQAGMVKAVILGHVEKWRGVDKSKVHARRCFDSVRSPGILPSLLMVCMVYMYPTFSHNGCINLIVVWGRYLWWMREG